jgi:flagellar hook-associated protein 2
MAGAINFSGIGSGLDFSKLTESILAERSRPISQLQTRNASNTKRSDALKQLNTRLASLTQAADALKTRDLGTGRISTSTDASVASVSVTETSSIGSFNLSVTRLATSLTQVSRTYGDDTTAVLAGGASTATFELRKGGASSGTAITIDSSNNTLTGLRDAINAADAGVTASVVDTDGTGTNYRLLLTSSETGSAGRVELVETTSTGTATDLALTATNPEVTGVDFSALNASFKYNGGTLTRSSNTITDVVAGTTLTIKETGSTSINISAKTSDLGEKIRSFVDAYNGVQDFVAGQYTKDGAGRPSGPLAGDPTLRSVQRQLRDALGAKSTANGGAFTSLTDIGISRDDAGKLTLNSTVFDDKLANSLSDVKALFAGKAEGYSGLANSIHTASNRLSDGVSGVVKTAIDGLTDSVKRTERTIADHLTRISNLRVSLARQFAAADAAINQLNGQSTSLTSVLKSLEPKTN